MDSHDTLEDVVAGILNDDDEHDGDDEDEDMADEVRAVNEETLQSQPNTLEEEN